MGLINPNCDLCGGMLWVPVVQFLDTDRVIGLAARTKAVIERVTEIDCEYVRNEQCHDCTGKAANDFVQENGQHYNGRLVGKVVIEEAWKACKMKKTFKIDIRKFAQEVPKTSTLLSGKTGRFKTLLLQSWYNILLYRENDSLSKFLWIREDSLASQFFFKDEGCTEFLARVRDNDVRYFFLDEILAPENYRGGEHHRNMTQIGYTRLWDYLCTHKNILVFATTNAEQLQLESAGAEWEKTHRRMDEIFGQNVIKI